MILAMNNQNVGLRYANPTYFFAGERDEAAHIHIDQEDKVAKFWLDPVRLHSNGSFSRNEIIRIQKVVVEYQIQLRETWNVYFHH
jgi:hypothetical protein